MEPSPEKPPPRYKIGTFFALIIILGTILAYIVIEYFITWFAAVALGIYLRG